MFFYFKISSIRIKVKKSRDTRNPKLFEIFKNLLFSFQNLKK